MRSTRPSASASVHAPPRARSQARTSPIVATSSGTVTVSLATPSASRTLAKYLSSIFIVTRHRDALAEQFGKRDETHRLAGANRMVWRIVDQAAAPHRRRQNGRALVRKQVEPTRRVHTSA